MAKLRNIKAGAGADVANTDSAMSHSSQWLESLYKNHWQELCNYLLKHYGAGPPEPEDIAQTAFAQFAALDNPQTIENPRAFLFRTARNLMVSQYRHSSVQASYANEKMALEEEQEGAEFDVERVLIGRERLTLVEAALRRMPRKRRRILIMNRFDGLTYAEISRQTGLSQSVVKRHVERALRDFQKALKAEEPGRDS